MTAVVAFILSQNKMNEDPRAFLYEILAGQRQLIRRSLIKIHDRRGRFHFFAE